MSKLSIIIPVFNAERYLRRCLDSIRRQSMRDFEVICIDDGSTDSSAAVLGEYAAQDSRFRVISQANAGQGAARNRGLDVAAGEYICFVDADDVLSGADILELLISEMEKRTLQLLMFDAVTRYEDGATAASAAIGNYRRIHFYPAAVSGMELFTAMNRRKEFSVSPCLYMFRKDAFDSVGIRFAEGVLHEDDVFTMSFLLSLDRVGHLGRVCYERWVHPGSVMTAASAERHISGYLFCCRWVEERLRERTLPRPVLRELKRCRVGYRHAVHSFTEKASLAPVIDYPLSEKFANLLRCLGDRGVVYTLGRILAGGAK